MYLISLEMIRLPWDGEISWQPTQIQISVSFLWNVWFKREVIIRKNCVYLWYALGLFNFHVNLYYPLYILLSCTTNNCSLTRSAHNKQSVKGHSTNICYYWKSFLHFSDLTSVWLSWFVFNSCYSICWSVHWFFFFLSLIFWMDMQKFIDMWIILFSLFFPLAHWH